MRGVSPVVSAVLVIFIAVVASVAIYFQSSTATPYRLQADLEPVSGSVVDGDNAIIRITNQGNEAVGPWDSLPTTNGTCYFMTSTLVSDDFESYDVSDVPSGSWTFSTSNSLNVTTIGNSSQLAQINQTAGTVYVYQPLSTTDNYYITTMAMQNTSGTTHPQPSLLVNWANINNFDAVALSVSSDVLTHIYKRTSGSLTFDTLSSPDLDHGTWYELSAAIIDDTATFYLNGDNQGTFSTGGFSNGGFRSVRTSDDNLGYFDNFTVYSLSSSVSLEPGHSTTCTMTKVPTGEVTLFPSGAIPFTVVFAS